jgi:hypothetical protein
MIRTGSRHLNHLASDSPMEPLPNPAPVDRARQVADGALLSFMVAAAFALGCQKLYDADVWWHLRAGQWIWANRRVPALDPFTFASVDRPWIDLHWLFQLILAAIYVIGGVPGMIVMTAAAYACVFLIAWTARDRRWPSWIVAACWLPALVVMSTRADPRPETLTLLAAVAYLAVLSRTDGRPELAWILPVIQVLWVNVHGLFVLGPIILGIYLIDRLAGRWNRNANAGAEVWRGRRRWWKHLAGAAVLVGLACLVNPYGLRGALLPLELFPKITAWGGLYKSYIAEFMDLREYVQGNVPTAAGNLYVRCECWLFWAVPLSFLVPAVWRAGRSKLPRFEAAHPAKATRTGRELLPAESALAPRGNDPSRSERRQLIGPAGQPEAIGPARELRSRESALAPRGNDPSRSEGRQFARSSPTVWLSAFGLAMGLLGACVLGFPGVGTPAWLVRLGRLAPIGLVALGIAGAVQLRKSFGAAAWLAALGGLAEAAWVVWLRAYLLGPEPGPAAWLGAHGPGLIALGGVTLVLGLAVAALSLRAGGRLYRMGLFAAFGYLALQALRNVSLFAVVAGFVLAANLGPWVTELVAEIPALGRRSWIRSRAGLAMRTALAGLAGLVVVAIATGQFPRGTGDSRQFGLSAEPLVYAHDAARFAGRPGLPDRALVYDTRQAGVYVFHNGPQRKVFLDGRLEVPRRETFETYVRVDRMLNTGAPGWKQALARMGDSLILLEHEIGFGAEATLLADPDWRCIYYDAVASVFIARRRRDLEASFPSVDFAARHFHSSLDDRPRQPILPAAAEAARARAMLDLGWAVRSRPGWSRQLPSSLMLLAGDYLRLAIDLEPTAPGPWTSLGIACWNLVADPKAFAPRLVEPWDPARGLLPAQAAYCFRRTLELNPAETEAAQLLDQVLSAQGMSDSDRARAIPRQRDSADADGRGISRDWPASDRAAATLLHLGRPAEAHRVWAGAADPPAPALRLARLAAADLAALDFAAAERTYRAALELDTALGEAWFGLAVLHTERGDAAAVVAVAREGLKHPLTPAQNVLLRDLEALAAPYAAVPSSIASPHGVWQTVPRPDSSHSARLGWRS